MAKSKNITFDVFLQSVGIYSSNVLSFLKYMAFPVFGQILGAILCFAPTYYFTKNIDILMQKVSFLQTPNNILITALLITLPGLIILLKAFWDYLVAYGAVNSMTQNFLKSGRIYDFKAHTQTVTRRKFQYIILWFIFGLFYTISLVPMLWILALLLFVFISLVFQIFTFEPELNAFRCYKRSFDMVKNDYFRTLYLLILVGILTYIFIPQIVNFILDKTNIAGSMALFLEPWAMQFPIADWNFKLTQLDIKYQISALAISMMLIQTTINFICIGLTLPLRSVAFTLWYDEMKKKSEKTTKNKSQKKNV